MTPAPGALPLARGRRVDGPSPRGAGTRLQTSWRTLGAVLVVVGFVAPLVLLVSGSLRKPGTAPPPRPELVPQPLAWDNYATAVDLGQLARATANSMAVALVAVPLSVLVAALAGFALTQASRRVVRLVVAATLVALMVPLPALLVPRFAMWRSVGLTDTLVPMVAPALLATSPF